ncbi:hypothetical protein CDAR_166751 [Caerostris darwini]|uniref:Uncharacterized protein n=1 Tax=Caerostris darwini TaxID=1538125 RepID=A0AAV4R450_9ARAC|nr:hypothetical protein CDAR_166751 [Caerostris darwini]
MQEGVSSTICARFTCVTGSRIFSDSRLRTRRRNPWPAQDRTVPSSGFLRVNQWLQLEFGPKLGPQHTQNSCQGSFCWTMAALLILQVITVNNVVSEQKNRFPS